MRIKYVIVEPPQTKLVPYSIIEISQITETLETHPDETSRENMASQFGFELAPTPFSHLSDLLQVKTPPKGVVKPINSLYFRSPHSEQSES